MNAVINIIFLIWTGVRYIGLLYITRGGAWIPGLKKEVYLNSWKQGGRGREGGGHRPRELEITFNNLRYKIIKQQKCLISREQSQANKAILTATVSIISRIFFGWSFHVFHSHFQPSKNPLDHFPEVQILKHISVCFLQWSFIYFQTSLILLLFGTLDSWFLVASVIEVVLKVSFILLNLTLWLLRFGTFLIP